MKYKNYDFDLSSVPRLKSNNCFVYHKIKLIEFLEAFEYILGKETIHYAKFYLDKLSTVCVNEKEVQTALEYKDILEQQAKDKEQYLLDVEKQKEDNILKSFESAFAVYIEEFPATFIVPFDTSELPQRLVDLIGTPDFPTDSLIAILQNRVKYVDGRPFAPEYCLDEQSAEWISNGLRTKEIRTVMTGRVNKRILELSKNYINKITTLVTDETKL